MRPQQDGKRDHLVLLKDVQPFTTTFYVSKPCFSNGDGLYLINGVSSAYEIVRLCSGEDGRFTATRGQCGSLVLKHEAGALLQPITAPEEEHGTQEDTRG